MIVRERNLDPTDWVATRDIFHAALDMGLDHVRDIAAGPVWRATPASIRAALTAPIPRTGTDLASLLSEFRDQILPYGTGNLHPAFMGWVHGGGNVHGALGEMLAALMNCNVGGRDHVAALVERQVLGWCKEMLDFPAEASGILTSGTSMATLIAMTVARNVKAGPDVARVGVAQAAANFVAYASTETHSCFVKAFDMLGFGTEAVRPVPVDDQQRIDIAALGHLIATDKSNGLKPFCAVGTAGTVNTGAIDDLDAVAAICTREGMWFHVDGAFGGLAYLLDRYRSRLTAIARADSVAFDFHKWLQVPYDAGCVLIRDAAAHRAAFSTRKEYLQGSERGLAAGEPWFCDFGPELSRTFRALKVWFTVRAHGLDALAAVLDQTVDLAGYLSVLVRAAEPRLKLAAPVQMNIVCFRYVADGLDDRAGDTLNKNIVAELQERGIAAPSTTVIKGRTVIRCALINHRTDRSTLDRLVASVLAIGTELTRNSG